MLKSLLQVLDTSPGSTASLKVGLALAQATQASVTGIAVVDPNVICPTEPVPMGASTYKEHKDTVLLERATARAQDLARGYGEEAKALGLQYSSKVLQGDTLMTLVGEADIHDLIVAGSDVGQEDGTGKVSDLIRRLLHGNPRPVVVSPVDPMRGDRLLVAYDGSIPAMRAIQMLCCLRLFEIRETLVLSVHQEMATAVRLSNRGVAFMTSHGYNATAMPVMSEDDPALAIVKAARDVGAGLVVAGAYGHGGWREWLLGSTTSRILATSPVPTFIHH